MTDGRWNRLSSWTKHSLQRKFALISALLLLATSVVFLVLVINGYRDRILTSHERASMNVNLLLQAALENAMIKRDIEGLQDIVVRLGAQDDIGGVMVVNPDGEIRFSSYPARLYQTFSDPAFASALETLEQQTGFRILEDGSEVLRSINPVHNKPECVECHGETAENRVNGLLVVDYDSSAVRSDTRGGALFLGALGILVLLTLEGGLWVALRRIVLDRIEELAGVIRRIARGELTVRARDQGNDEIAGLGESFNFMSERLDKTLGDLRASEGFLQALIDAIPDGVRVIDSDFRIIAANQTYCTQIGVPPDDVIGSLCYSSSHKRESPCVPTLVECPVKKCILEGQPELKCSHVHITGDGGKMPVEVMATPVEVIVDGRTRNCVVESIRDLETQFSISQEQRMSEMGMLAAGVAHEVQNPLSSIALALGAIRTDLGQSESAKRYIGIAETEIANCQAITDSLLRLATPSQETPELVDMSGVVNDTIALLSYEAENAQATLESEIAGKPRVLASDSDMRNLAFNLLHNAIHAMPNGGKARVACRTEGGRVIFEVSDTGVGIAPRDRENIMMPFWTKRADGSMGRGLGLALVKGIVDRLGGEIEMDSTLGHGTRFKISLPSADEARS